MQEYISAGPNVGPVQYNERLIEPNPKVINQVGLSTEALSIAGIELKALEINGNQPEPIDINSLVPLRQYGDDAELVAVIDLGGMPVEVIRHKDPQRPRTYLDRMGLYPARGIRPGELSGMVRPGEKVVLGRAENAGQRFTNRLGLIDSSEVSRKHVTITGLGNGIFGFKDENSLNGTRIIAGIRDPAFYNEQTSPVLAAVNG